MPTILLVDDEPSVHETFEDAMEAGVRVVHAHDGMAALSLLDREEVDVLVTDLTMPNLDGLSLLREVRGRGLDLPSLILSAHGRVPNVVEALRLGALDFIEKSGDTERLRVAVAAALGAAQRQRERRELEARAGVDPRVLEGLVGGSRAMRELVDAIRVVAPKRARVLVTGENGTGKELVARALHQGSERAGGPFVRTNCAALAESVVESELFGHEKGAFSGAIARRAGRFERAQGGTLFLDEVGEMPLAVQPKLLRAIEAGEIERVGGEETLEVDVRVVAATNCDLEASVREGTFREDLFYRLNVVPLHVPPLRDRLDDLEALSTHFLRWASNEEAVPERRLEPAALGALREHDWPGNVRELRNLIERLVIFSESREITEERVRRALPRREAAERGAHGLLESDLPLRDVVAEAERQAIRNRLERFDGNKTRAAESLGLERSHLYKKMRALDMSDES